MKESIFINKELHDKAKKKADEIYKKPSAYKSGFIVQEYKRLGGTFKKQKERPLERWYKEQWTDVGGPAPYPVYRPTKKINKKTPLTVEEIDPKNLKEQIKKKQIIKGKENLPPFKKK